MDICRAGRFARSVVVVATALACLVLISSAGTSDAGIQGSGYAYRMTTYGRITQFGSIFVNGVEYDTSAANIRIDGLSGSQSQLRVGQVVTVQADVNADATAGAATDVSFASDVVGPLAQVDLAGGTLIVLGQKIHLLGDTLLDLHLGGLLGLLPGIMVQISGFPNAAGEIQATRIDLVLGMPTLRLKGAVQDLDTAAHTFRVNTQTVNYADVVPAGTLANGSTVSVQGSIPLGQTAVRATGVDLVSGLGGAAGDFGQLEGLITAFNSGSDFMVGLQRVITDADTQFLLNGQTLGPNVPVEVRGEFNADGALVAREIQVSPQGLLAAAGLVESVSPADHSVRVLGVNVTTSDATTFADQSSQNLRPFALSDVRAGDYVEVRGAAAGAGVQATTVKRSDPLQDFYLEGAARELAAPAFKVLGVRVLTTPQTRLPTSGLLASLQFFLTASGKTVRVHGSQSGDTLIATRVELVK